MKINKFVWDNYKNSDAGKNAIEIFSSLDVELICNNYFKEINKYNDGLDYIDDLFYIKEPPLPEEMEENEAEAYFNSLLDNGISVGDENATVQLSEARDYQNNFDQIPLISLWLYCVYPDFYKPYLYFRNIKLLIKILDAFGIEIAEIPQKKDKEKRSKYYWEINKTLNTFQNENSFSNEELCAFMYDFAPKYLDSENSQKVIELPSPTQIWMVGGNIGGSDIEFLNNAKDNDKSYWQGNINTKRGDIVIMYCLSPHSCIHSIWRADSDGHADPFFYFYSLINITDPIRLTDIHIKELKSDQYFSEHSLVRSNMQGLNGRTLSSKDYIELQRMLKDKGFEISKLPILYQPEFSLGENLLNERDVETTLLEPLFEKLGFNASDWIRQLTVRMGRGERNYPDYSFFTSGEKGYEKSKMIIEAKFYIKTNKDLEETFRQAHSYAMRLEASTIMLCDKNSIWIYLKNASGFDRTKYFKKYWKELENVDEFNKLKEIFRN